MLFVDDYQSGPLEDGVVMKECMSADHRTGTISPRCRGFLSRGGDERDRDPERCEPGFEGPEMLLGQDLGRGHENGTVAGFQRQKHRGGSDKRLSRTDIPLQ